MLFRCKISQKWPINHEISIKSLEISIKSLESSPSNLQVDSKMYPEMQMAQISANNV